MVAAYARRRAANRYLDPHCAPDARSARRHSRRLSTAQPGDGDVSGERGIPNPAGAGLPRLAVRNCRAFAQGAIPGNGSKRHQPGRERQLSDCDDRGLRLVGQECSRCEGVGSWNSKYRALAEISSRPRSARGRRAADFEEAYLPSAALIPGSDERRRAMRVGSRSSSAFQPDAGARLTRYRSMRRSSFSIAQQEVETRGKWLVPS